MDGQNGKADTGWGGRPLTAIHRWSGVSQWNVARHRPASSVQSFANDLCPGASKWLAAGHCICTFCRLSANEPFKRNCKVVVGSRALAVHRWPVDSRWPAAGCKKEVILQAPDVYFWPVISQWPVDGYTQSVGNRVLAVHLLLVVSQWPVARHKPVVGDWPLAIHLCPVVSQWLVAGCRPVPAQLDSGCGPVARQFLVGQALVNDPR